jgi:hypothetical protein
VRKLASVLAPFFRSVGAPTSRNGYRYLERLGLIIMVCVDAGIDPKQTSID